MYTLGRHDRGQGGRARRLPAGGAQQRRLVTRRAHRDRRLSRPCRRPGRAGAAVEPYDVVVAMRERTPFPRSLIERLPRLRLLVTTAQRNASIDVAAAAERGVVVCGTDMVPTGTPELTWGLLLAAHRHLETELSNMRSGGWQTTVGTELAGRTIGLLGLGRIGSRMARYAHAFDMTVLAWSQNLTDERAAENGAAAGRARRAVPPQRRRQHPSAARRPHPWPGRRGRARPAGRGRVAGQHLARADRRRGGADRGAARATDRRRRARRLRRRAAAGRTTRCGRCPTPCSHRTSATSPGRTTRATSTRGGRADVAGVARRHAGPGDPPGLASQPFSSGLSNVAGRSSSPNRPSGHTIAQPCRPRRRSGRTRRPPRRGAPSSPRCSAGCHPSPTGARPGRDPERDLRRLRTLGQVVGSRPGHAVDGDLPLGVAARHVSPGSPMTRLTRWPPVGQSPTASSAVLHRSRTRPERRRVEPGCESSKTTTSPRWTSPFQYDTFSTRMRSSFSNRGRIEPDGTKKLCTRKVLVTAASAERDDRR